MTLRLLGKQRTIPIRTAASGGSCRAGPLREQGEPGEMLAVLGGVPQIAGSGLLKNLLVGRALEGVGRLGRCASGTNGSSHGLPTHAAGACIPTMKATPICLFILAMIAVPLANSEGVADLIQRAEKGEAAAQLELGGIYTKGEGVTKDVAEGVKWLTAAAEQGNAEAQMKLGGLYVGGRGVLKNSIVAAKWFTMSAKQGNAAAQCQLGRMHMTGAGVPKDDVEAYKWANLAAAQGDPAARKVLVALVIRMTPGQIADGKQRSQDFLDSKNADILLDLPADPPELPVEPLPLLVPEQP